jgi:hypothetical protein
MQQPFQAVPDGIQQGRALGHKEGKEDCIIVSGTKSTGA